MLFRIKFSFGLTFVSLFNTTGNFLCYEVYFTEMNTDTPASFDLLAFYFQPIYLVIFRAPLMYSKKLGNVFLSLCQPVLIDVFRPFTFSND